MTSPHNQYSFAPDPHTAEYLTMNDRHNDRSPSPGRKFWPFNRSRSSSPNTQGHALHLDTSFNTTRSRKSSANSQNAAISPSGSASSFVVRSVIRNPGGVSLPTTPADDQPHGFFGGSQRQQSPSPGARTMTLEDSDDDMGQPSQLQYRRSKSKPLGATSLGVPPGGPGGGVGYGTARSSNDGRPESATAGALNQTSPYYRPASPSGSITAGDFHRGAKERGRSPRKSISAASSSSAQAGHQTEQIRSGSAHSAASMSNAKKPVARITAGPKSLAQQQQEAHQHHHQQGHFQQQQHQASSRGPSPAVPGRPAGMSGPRQFPGGPPSPSGPHQHPQQHYVPAPRNHSAGPPSMDQRGNVGVPLLPPQQPPAHEARDDSPSRSRRFSFGIVGRSRKDSEKALQQPDMPGAAPLDGLPSPVDIPYGRSPHSPLRFDNGAETDYSRANSPFGSASPARVAGSPNSSGFLSTLMGRQATEDRDAKPQPRHHDDVPRSCSPGGGGSNLAGKWFKGVFGRSPRADEKDPNYAADLSPYPFQQTNGRDAEDEAAYAQKLASMRQARHIVDEERQRHMMAPTTPTGRFDPNHDREFRPRQVVDSDVDDAGLDAALEFELGRKKSPPGRKPVPAYLPAAKTADDRDAFDDEDETRQEEPLTPAQCIIQETRSKQLAREQIEAQRKEALSQQQKMANPRATMAANAQLNGPPTPPKSKAEPNVSGHQQRFPSGVHQITREPGPSGAALAGSAAPANANTSAAAGPRTGSTLSPGTGPLPADMPLRDALQEMMVRFYRFERYSVPLIRSLETRLLDIERDAMLANNPQARTASIASHNSAEMDRWVHQMSSLMKHEVAQLKAATREIKESRELVATVARHAAAGTATGMGLSMSVSSFGSLAAITPSASLQQVPKPADVAAAKARETNVSSSTFESAVPRRSNLALPAGAKPMLGKEEGKHTATASPTKAIFGFASESAKEQSQVRDRSVSPNGRPRYTSVLGQPLQPAQQQKQGQGQGRLSPAPSTEASEAQGGMKRDVSVEDRLKALMEGREPRSRSGSVASASTPAPPPAEDQQRNLDGDESESSDIAAALAAIDATSSSSFAPREPKTSEQPRGAPAIAKSASNSSSGTVEEPLTPTVELAAEPAAVLAAHRASPSKSISEDSTFASSRPSALAYLKDEVKPTSPVKSHFGAASASSSSSSPVPASSGRISPNKLFAHKFAATGSTSSTGSASGASPSAKLGLVEKKRFTLPTPAAPAVGLGRPGAGVVTTVQARNGGKISRTPSYSLEDAAPTSNAFSGLAKVKPVGHTATLRERVAFFDTAK